MRAATEAMEIIGLERVVFIPSQNPPLKKENIAPASDRFRMVEIAVADNPRFMVSDIEARREGTSFTAHTILELRSQMPEGEFYFIMGMDTFLDLPCWHMPQSLMDETNPVVLLRPPFNADSVFNSPFIDTEQSINLDFTEGRVNVQLKNGRDLILLQIPPIDISSTMIRNHLKYGRSIKYLVPEAVEEYIQSEGCGYIKEV
ncbi:MAG: nicotinate (nicotinamide) nucleotide adenylyltransferase [Nitrospirae bacterium]|nr:nicotinate (nicotinamide) nucleotide adenylyltransferase [Nitrospirota bacterium]